jgi:hypothetical protein
MGTATAIAMKAGKSRSSAARAERREETQHDAGQRCHELDARLHVALQVRVHELRGVHRAEHAERDGEQQRVEGALEGADQQRNQRQLGLEGVVAARRLPHEGRSIGVLVPDPAEQRCERQFGVGGGR